MPADLSLMAFALCCLAAGAGGVVQTFVGFGYALLVVPVLLLVEVDLVPVAPLVVAAPMVMWLAWVDRADLDVRGFARVTAGRVPGTVLGVLLLGTISTAALSEAAGALLIAAAALSAARGPRTTTPAFELGAGVASGFAGTVSAVGGPYVGLAFADREPTVLRATVSAAFAVGILVSLLALALAGEVDSQGVLVGVALLPATVVGLWVGRRANGLVNPSWVRPAVIAFAAASGVFALARGVLG